MSAQEEEGRIKDYRGDCTIHFQMILVGSLSCQHHPSQDHGALQIEVQFFPHFQLELIETLQQHMKFILVHKILWSVCQSIFPWKTVSTNQNSRTFVGKKSEKYGRAWTPGKHATDAHNWFFDGLHARSEKGIVNLRRPIMGHGIHGTLYARDYRSQPIQRESGIVHATKLRSKFPSFQGGGLVVTCFLVTFYLWLSS